MTTIHRPAQGIPLKHDKQARGRQWSPVILTDPAGPPRTDERWREGFVLLDRRAERAAIDRVLNAVRSGLSGTLVLRGGPGVGKSTLLKYAVEAAPDLRVSSIAGVESEISMEFAGLHQLLVPCLPQLDDLPAPQRGALRSRFRPGSRAAAGTVPGGTGRTHAAVPGG